jgi:predicted lactoylglutathione lyase
MSRKIFVNLLIRNLERSTQFFKALGFAFDPKFTDDKATCMVISEGCRSLSDRIY